jgi:hypothetical protein
VLAKSGISGARCAYGAVADRVSDSITTWFGFVAVRFKVLLDQEIMATTPVEWKAEG